MSEFTDWFVADRDEAADLANALRDELADGWERLSLREVNEAAIAALGTVLIGGGFRYRAEVVYPDDDASHEARSSDDADDNDNDDGDVDEGVGGVFIKVVPEELVDAIAALDEGALGEMAHRWRLRAEGLRGISVDDLAVVLGSMRELANLAVESNKSVLFAFED